MSELASQVFQQAEAYLRSGKYDEALGGYLAVMRGVPNHFRSRFRIADTLLNLKQVAPAFEIYRTLAWHAIKAGEPLRGLVAIKMAAAMDRSQGELVHVVATLYGRDSDRVDTHQTLRFGSHLGAQDVAGDVQFLSGDPLVAAAAEEAAQMATSDFPERLPAIPLFSFLDEEAFGGVLEDLKLRRFMKGQTILRQGEPGRSFFMLAEGAVVVTRDVGGRTQTLARLPAGAVFGEMALISNAPRTATVTAWDDCEVLELERASLEQQGNRLQSVTEALRAFTHQRFLANLTATSPVFRKFPPSMRAEITAKFEPMKVPPGHVVIREGDVGKGLFLVLKGEVSVTKGGADGAAVALASLTAGDVLGEISLLQESPTTATCTTQSPCELLFLPKSVFHSTMARHPDLKAELAKLTEDRLRHTQEMLDPDSEHYIMIEDDDLIML